MFDLLLARHPLGKCLLLGFCGAVLVFLMGPLLVIVPLSFNSEPYFTFPLAGFSTRWYEAFFESDNWLLALRNSIVVGSSVAVLSVALGTMAAIGLARLRPGLRRSLTAILLAPMILPLVISGIAIYFAYARLGLTDSLLGLVLAHTMIASPFVVIAVTAVLARFDETLMRAAASLGAGSLTAFWRVRLPLILPGIATGAIFAFVASFDDIVIALFVTSAEQRTLPRQMWSGVRENLDPTILAVATMLVALSALVTLSTAWLGARRQRQNLGRLA
jgi:putative spermidine/putrescine transport system permease protein